MILSNHEYINTCNSINTVHWIITKKCNEDCNFCFSKGESIDLEIEKAYLILDRLKKDGWKTIKYTGGEPLLYRHINLLIRKSKEMGFTVHLHTNALLLSNKWLLEYSKYIDLISLSLDADTQELQLKMTRNSNHFRKNIEILEFLKNNQINLDCAVKTVITKINSKNISKLAKLLQGYLIKYWVIFEFRTLGPAVNYSKNFEIETKDYEVIRDKIASEFKEKMDILFVSKKDAHAPYLFINPNGLAYTINPVNESNVELCNMLGSDIGSVKNKVINVYA